MFYLLFLFSFSCMTISTESFRKCRLKQLIAATVANRFSDSHIYFIFILWNAVTDYFFFFDR